MSLVAALSFFFLGSFLYARSPPTGGLSRLVGLRGYKDLAGAHRRTVIEAHESLPARTGTGRFHACGRRSSVMARTLPAGRSRRRWGRRHGGYRSAPARSPPGTAGPCPALASMTSTLSQRRFGLAFSSCTSGYEQNGLQQVVDAHHGSCADTGHARWRCRPSPRGPARARSAAAARAPGWRRALSILLMATMASTPAALAWLMASMVTGHYASRRLPLPGRQYRWPVGSAGTHGGEGRMSAGVSRKVIFWPFAADHDKRRCAG